METANMEECVQYLTVLLTAWAGLWLLKQIIKLIVLLAKKIGG